MIQWLRNALAPKAAPLSGAPTIRRRKTYSAESGYVYQYHYEGSREVTGGREYVFAVSPGRGAAFPVSVLLLDSALEPWERNHGRSLSAPERFATAKLSLKDAFDARESPERMRQPVTPDSEVVASILSMLDVD